jgi:NAD+ synthase
VDELDVRAMFAARPDAYLADTTVDLIGGALRTKARSLTRRGAVVGVSGGVDSAACAALMARVFPRDRVRLVHLPDKDTGSESTSLAQDLADSLEMELLHRDITAALRGLDVYDELAARVGILLDRRPDEVGGWKLVRTEPVAGLPVRWRIVATLVDGTTVESPSLRPTDLAYLVARMNCKQQMRASVLYRLAEENHFMVIGTSNRVEIRTGFFVRHGDGAGDEFPLRSLYKAEVRRLAADLGVPPAISSRTATTDTYSASQTQAEFYFGIDEGPFDYVLFGFEHDLPADRVAAAAGISPTMVEGIYADLTRRQPFLRYLLSYALTEDMP